MNGHDNLLSLLGLALRGGRLAVGDEPTALAAEGGKARLILLAADAGEKTSRRGAHLAEEGHCLLLILPCSKAELGGALGRGSAAIIALTDLGLAAAVVKKLAALDPECYEDAARRMDLKLRRAKERKTAPRRQPPPPERRPSPPGGRRDRQTGGPKDGTGPKNRRSAGTGGQRDGPRIGERKKGPHSESEKGRYVAGGRKPFASGTTGRRFPKPDGERPRSDTEKSRYGPKPDKRKKGPQGGAERGRYGPKAGGGPNGPQRKPRREPHGPGDHKQRGGGH